MIRFDLDEVHAIEKASYPFPWSRQIFGDCLRMDYCCRVVDFEADVAGYAILSTGAGESHLLNLCIGGAFRGRGLGRLLLEGMLVEARLREARRMFLEVRPSNRPAMALYLDSGFRNIGRRPDYYPCDIGREDALVMVRNLDEDR